MSSNLLSASEVSAAREDACSVVSWSMCDGAGRFRGGEGDESYFVTILAIPSDDMDKRTIAAKVAQYKAQQTAAVP